MHILNRLLVITLLLLSAVPVGMSAVLFADLREQATEELSVALGEAQDGYRKTVNISANESANKRVAERAKAKMEELGKKKRELRLQIVNVRTSLGHIATDAASLVDRETDSRAVVNDARSRLAQYYRSSYLRHLENGPQDMVSVLMKRLRGEPTDDAQQTDMVEKALARAQQKLIANVLLSDETLDLSQSRLHAAAGDAGTRLTALEDEWERITAEYRATQKEFDRAEANLELGERQLAEIRAITAEVQAEILRMQGELARIDTRLRTQAERKLIQMGLREDRPGRYAEPEGPTQSFLWPVRGRISAGFLDAAYKRFFGVPHKAIDIVVPQGTPVASAADGIVFLARDGGLRGYSYILIGHRDGYATLYGHLFSFAVSAGQTVSRGETIGISGGAPGTHGAGPMTTAPHLHFEVMKNGVHVDPRTVLP